MRVEYTTRIRMLHTAFLPPAGLELLEDALLLEVEQREVDCRADVGWPRVRDAVVLLVEQVAHLRMMRVALNWIWAVGVRVQLTTWLPLLVFRQQKLENNPDLLYS